MSPRSDQPAFEAPGVPADAGLRCPQCEYNLTGLTENRCPECGLAFDPEMLHRIQAGVPMPVPRWEDHSGLSLIVRFWGVCRMTWFDPAEFGRKLPWGYDPGAAVGFWLTARATMIVVLSVGALVGAMAKHDWGLASLVLALMVTITVVCSLLCEAVVALALALLVKPKFRPQPARTLPDSVPASTSWWGLVTFYGGFLPVMALILAADLISTMVWDPRKNEYVLAALELGPLLWWSWALGEGVAARSMPGFRLFVARCLIPVIGAASFCLGRFICCRP